MKRDHVKLICDVGELSALFRDAPSMEAFLQKVVELIAEHMDSDVCSIYLFYEDNNELVLKATKGLHPDSVNNVKMKLTEGLTGQALREMRSIRAGHARANPDFRYFPGIGEERFESFLAVPIVRGAVRIGVMVIQSERKDHFTEDDAQIFRAITSQLANTIETARLLMILDETRKMAAPVKRVSDLKFVKGRVGSEGVCFAPAIVMDENSTQLSRYLAEPPTDLTLEDFHRAVELTERQLEQLQTQIESALFDVASLIFTAQILMLKDKVFVDGIVDLIKGGKTPVTAVIEIVENYVWKLNQIDNAYLREKIHDVKDVGRRLLDNLAGAKDTSHEYAGKLLIAKELLPSDALKLYSQKVSGIILLSGGVTSHVSILSRSLNVPLIIADEPGLLSIKPGTPVLLDAVMGQIHIDPAKELLSKIREREDLHKDMDSLKALIQQSPCTKDGVAVKLMANINLLGDIKAALEFNAQGIGLYRTEFPFIMRSNFPVEEEQFQIYKRLLDGMQGKEVTFRTLDIGGDKVLSYYNNEKEENPFLGLRSIRFSLRHREIFMQQIRAILRAGMGAPVRIMFPMISSLDEFYQAREIVQECIKDLTKEKHGASKVKLGVMIELPSVLEIIDDLAREADFFSIGTNDFIQYILAVDRTNEKVADMYVPHHPSVLRGLKKVVDAAVRFKKGVSVCGDMAHNLKYFAFFLGIGIREFSVDARYLPRMHKELSGLKIKDTEDFAKRVLEKTTVRETSQLFEPR